MVKRKTLESTTELNLESTTELNLEEKRYLAALKSVSIDSSSG